MRMFLLTAEEKTKLERVRDRLYSQKRMDADEMRDNAALINGVIEFLIEV